MGDNQLIVVHIVAGGIVSDNANLMCQLMANALGHFTAAPAAPGAPAAPKRAFPPNVRLQVDGVSTNWGLVTLAFICFLVMAGIISAFDMCRNPVGVHHLADDLMRLPVPVHTPQGAYHHVYMYNYFFLL